jgi:rhodanese-related sulfurtransferase
MAIKHIKVQTLQQRLQKDGELPLILDVRESDEFEIANIQGSILIPLSEIQQRINELDKQQEIVVICHHGMRSHQVADFLVYYGFEDVSNLIGGIDAWSCHCDPAVPRY